MERFDNAAVTSDQVQGYISIKINRQGNVDGAPKSSEVENKNVLVRDAYLFLMIAVGYKQGHLIVGHLGFTR